MFRNDIRSTFIWTLGAYTNKNLLSHFVALLSKKINSREHSCLSILRSQATKCILPSISKELIRKTVNWKQRLATCLEFPYIAS